MADRVSPLADLLAPRVLGLRADDPGVALSTRADLRLWRAAAWDPAACAAALGAAAGVAPPPPGRFATGPGGTLARVGPLEWWLIDGSRPALDPAAGTLLDLSCGWTPVGVAGRDAAALLARLVAVDLRDAAFPVGAFAATGGAQMMLKLRRTGPEAFELFVMRSYAHFLWETLADHARQFGLRIA